MPLYRQVIKQDLRKAGITDAMMDRCRQALQVDFAPPARRVKRTAHAQTVYGPTRGQWACGGMTERMLHRLEKSGLFAWEVYQREGLVDLEWLVPTFVGLQVGLAAQSARDHLHVPVAWWEEQNK